jgi:hypothetical protein
MGKLIPFNNYGLIATPILKVNKGGQNCLPPPAGGGGKCKRGL